MVIKNAMLCMSGLFLCSVAIAQGAKTNEMRTVRDASKITSRALLESATLSGVTIAPNGKFVSVRVHRADVSADRVHLEWYILSLENGRVLAKTNGGDPDWIPSGDLASEVPQWSKDSRWLYFRMIRAGQMALWRLGLDGRLEQVVAGPSDIDGFLLDDKHHRIFYWTGPSRRYLREAKRQEYEQGVILNGTQYIDAPLENNWPYRSGMGSVRLLHRYGEWVWLPVGDDGARTTMVYDLNTSQIHAATPRSNANAIIGYDFASDSTTVMSRIEGVGPVLSSARSERSGNVAFVTYGDPTAKDVFGHHSSAYILGLRRAQNGKIAWCKDPRCRYLTGGVVWRPGTDEFLFTTARPPDSVGRRAWKTVTMFAWNETTGGIRMVFRTREMIGPNGYGAYSEQCPSTNGYAVCAMEGATDPPILALIDLDSGEVKDLFDPNVELRSSITDAGIRAHTKYMAWRDERGLTHTGVFLSSRLTGNAGAAPPLVITSYVCMGFLRGGTGRTVPEFVLWQKGFAVLCTNGDNDETAPNFRSGRVPAGQVTRMEYMFDGWKSAVRLLASKRLVNARRVGISGLSFTGETVNYVVTHHPQFAAAATAGHLDATDPIDFFIAGGTGNKAIIRGYGLLDPRTLAGMRYYQIASDAFNAGGICAPLLVQTDEAEFGSGIEYYGALRLDGAPAEVIVFPEESHLFWQPQHVLIMEERNVDWFRFWLQHYRSPDPEKQARYARWARIRNLVRPSCGRAH